MLNLPLGSLYAFSVFLKPLEALLGLSRAELALVFALASAGFGGGANLTPYVYGLAPTPVLVLACATSTMLGITLAATAGNLLQLAVGYGLCFGAGGGAAYILSQQVVNLAVTRHHGLVNGYLVGLYPAGAVIAAPLFGWGIRAFGVRATLGALATALGVTGLISAWLITRAGVTLSSGAAATTPEEHPRSGRTKTSVSPIRTATDYIGRSRREDAGHRSPTPHSVPPRANSDSPSARGHKALARHETERLDRIAGDGGGR
ncbi:MAG TPA: MFS transporter, partial [Methylomirabilota bacterium]|nr:MFS transporter [Methylomirabilota bacterium]